MEGCGPSRPSYLRESNYERYLFSREEKDGGSDVLLKHSYTKSLYNIPKLQIPHPI